MTAGNELEKVIAAYGEAWNSHNVEAILAMHTEDSVFENHTSGGVWRRQGRHSRDPERGLRRVSGYPFRCPSNLRARRRGDTGMDSDWHAGHSIHEGQHHSAANWQEGLLEWSRCHSIRRQSRCTQGRLRRLGRLPASARVQATGSIGPFSVSAHVSYGDNVRILRTAETERLGIAELIGNVYGETTPSDSKVEVIGKLEYGLRSQRLL